MKINRVSLGVSALVVIFMFSTSAVFGGWLDEATVTPIVGVTNNALDYRRAAASGARNTTFNSLSVTLGIAGEKWFGRVNGEFPLNPGRFTGGTSSDVKRSDYSVSIGYPVLPRVSVFGGYLLTNIRLTNSSFTENQDDTGFFVGTSVDVYQGNSSTISVNAAYANLSGTAVRSGGVFDVNGTTTGLSLGLNWTGRLGKDGHTYVLSYKNQNFKFNGNSGINAPQTIDKVYSVVTFAILL